MARVWAHSQQSGGALLVMLALADFANDAGECWPSIPVLAQKARLTDREIRYLLPKLEKAGEVRLQRSNGGRNRRNRYVVTVTENPESISVKNIQGNSFSEICDIKTLKSTSGALNRHRTVNSSAARQKRSHALSKDSDSRIKELRDTWAALYSARTGEKYLFTGKDFGSFKSALQAFDSPRLKEFMARFFENADAWVKEKAGFTVGVFHSKLNSLASTSSGTACHSQRQVMTI